MSHIQTGSWQSTQSNQKLAIDMNQIAVTIPAKASFMTWSCALIQWPRRVLYKLSGEKAGRKGGNRKRGGKKKCEEELTQDPMTPTTWKIQVLPFHRPRYDFKTTCVQTIVQLSSCPFCPIVVTLYPTSSQVHCPSFWQACSAANCPTQCTHEHEPAKGPAHAWLDNGQTFTG